jgi:hypothetical protein
MYYASSSQPIDNESMTMSPHPPVFFAIRQELYDWRLWTGRGVVLAFAALAGAFHRV